MTKDYFVGTGMFIQLKNLENCTNLKLGIHPESSFGYLLTEGDQILNMFEQICNGVGNRGQKSYSTQKWTDEDTGYEYSSSDESGWQINNNGVESSMLKQEIARKNLIFNEDTLSWDAFF